MLPYLCNNEGMETYTICTKTHDGTFTAEYGWGDYENATVRYTKIQADTTRSAQAKYRASHPGARFGGVNGSWVHDPAWGDLPASYIHDEG